MNFYGNLNNQLLKQAYADTNRVNAVDKGADDMNMDMDHFSDLLKNERFSTIALHEQIRAKHTLLKTALDGVQ